MSRPPARGFNTSNSEDLSESADILENALHRESPHCSDLQMVDNYASKPCWVCKNGSVYVEVESPHFKRATNFLIAITEPQSRPQFLHHYKVTAYSLYAGASVNLTTEAIVRELQSLAKNVLPRSVVKFVETFTKSYGKVKLVLKRNRVFIESADIEVLRTLMRNDQIRLSMVTQASHLGDEDGVRTTEVQAESRTSKMVHLTMDQLEQEEEEEFKVKEKTLVRSIEIVPERVGIVKQVSTMLNYPMMEEYDFKADDVNPDLPIDLKGFVKTREYQDKALDKMFSNKRARSGVIVLPCGAGKTLTGISATTRIKKSTIVLCSSQVAVKQWIAQYYLFTNISSQNVCEFTSSVQPTLLDSKNALLLVTTYSMMGMKDERRQQASREAMQKIKSREWGLLLLDEVHMAPAQNFRQALYEVRTHCKLGLTATLVREDEQIGDLNFLIGPKLYEADWMDLTERGYLARVQCAEVWCPMSSQFMSAYLSEKEAIRKQLLYVMNPNKFAACEFLMKDAEASGDKVLIFSDTVAAVEEYGRRLHRNFMHGSTANDERNELLRKFRLPASNPKSIQTLVISKIGDVAIDLPEANVIIQVSSHFGSRRQEAQRLGRILRPKSTVAPGRFNAVFYTLVSQDTTEMGFSTQRRQYLVDQGYAFKVVLFKSLFPKLTGDYFTVVEQRKMLNELTVEKSQKEEWLPSTD